ncbi:ABC transporter ATP-binding protein/permease [Sporomusa termitida]|uniref:Vitamin B12 transport ATP-binding protein BacA n=1 Tax=Sporomusa termitida TaxID=2377 RepID=A0A517E0Z4_9FIRM|nr:ABC transporter ATP-binding protein/permease [Sporomusa termitida]QDR83270.1 Vitamin B12 transport ATP-binding protein BacA [Sporomusa termitida]
MAVLDRKFLQATWSLIREYWHSEEKWPARGLLAVIVTLNLTYVYILVLINKWFNRFYNALQNFDKEEVFSALGEFCLLAACYIIVAVYQLYLQQMLEIKWRRWMTHKYLNNWLTDRMFYRLQLTDSYTDNPDQRISEDLRLFTNYTLALSLGLLKAFVTLVSFIAILWQLSGILVIPLGSQQLVVSGYMVWVAIIYSVIGTWLAHKIGKPLARLNFDQQRYEADFRFSLVRLRENSESIAFYGGEAREERSFIARFGKVFNNYWQIMQRRKQLTWFASGYGQIAIIFPLVVAMPRYFAKEIQLGGLLQIAKAFDSVQESLSYFVSSYASIAEWKAVVDRLTGFISSMQQVSTLPQGNSVIEVGPEAALVVSDLSIDLPDGQRILSGLNLTIQAGESLLVAGPSGSGKSTLLRTLSGLWPYAQGRITIPAGHTFLFLPQRSYLPLGTLRDTLLYPGLNRPVADEEIIAAMSICKLEGLKSYLDKTEDWSHILSLGEQQRIAFVRVFIHQPDWLFMDEATSALDEATERQLYGLVQERLAGTTLVSVGHRNTLNSYHKKKLSLDGRGHWNLLVM